MDFPHFMRTELFSNLSGPGRSILWGHRYSRCLTGNPIPEFVFLQILCCQLNRILGLSDGVSNLFGVDTRTEPYGTFAVELEVRWPGVQVRLKP